MRNKDLIELERREREASAAADQAKTQEGGQEPGPDTQPEDNGGDGRMFTQAEVNRIIAERLARERAKQGPTAEEQRAAELDARESRMKCRDFLDQRQLIPDLLDLFSTDNYEEFVQSVEKLMYIRERANELGQKGGEPSAGKASPNGLLRAVFGLN